MPSALGFPAFWKMLDLAPVTIPRMPFAEVVLLGGFNIPCPLTPWSLEVAGLAPALPNPMWMKEQCSWQMLPGLGPNVAVSVKVNVSALKRGYARKEAGLEQCEAVFLWNSVRLYFFLACF